MFIEAVNGTLVNLQHIETIEVKSVAIPGNSESETDHHVSPKSSDGKSRPSLFVGKGPQGLVAAENYLSKLKVKLMLTEQILTVSGD